MEAASICVLCTFKSSTKLKPTIFFTSSIDIRTFCASSLTQSQTQTQPQTQTQTQNLNHPKIIVPNRRRWVVAASNAQLKENWLASLYYPSPTGNTHVLDEEQDLTHKIEGSIWILGIDLDVSGAVALLKIHDSICSAQ